MGSGFGGLDFSHEGVKQVVGLLVGFVFAIARAACSFLYLNNEYMITKKKKKKEKKKKSDQEIGSSRNYLSTFLYIRYCNTITLYIIYTPLLYESLGSKNPETIVIVSTGDTNIELLL